MCRQPDSRRREHQAYRLVSALNPCVTGEKDMGLLVDYSTLMALHDSMTCAMA